MVVDRLAEDRIDERDVMIYILLTLFAVVNVSALIIDTPSTRVAPAHLADSVPMSINPTRAVGQQYSESGTLV